ncbi:MAG: glycosyl transferase, partial [Patescibacteria group bacterium]
MKKTYIVLVLIGILAFFLRFYNATQIPPSLSWDEVSIGYNAYSILKTGRDEFGRFLPLDAFVAYGDYKPVLPIYL